MLVKAVKHLSGLVFDPYTDELLRRLGETHNKLLERPFAYEFYHQMCSFRSELVAPFSEVVIQK